jgi:protein O-mannosyl-transferase
MASKIKEESRTTFSKEISKFIYPAMLIILPLILFWKTINYKFTTLDDTKIISTNIGFLGDFGNVSRAFQKDNFMSNEGSYYYRPIQTISFMVDAHLSAENPAAYHCSNLLYHILTVIAVFFLLNKLGVSNKISLGLALLFSVHPFLTNAIAWIPGRGDLLAGLFGTISFLTFIEYCSAKNKAYLLFHAGAFFIAVFSKEIAVLLPIVMIFYYWFVLGNKFKVKSIFPFIVFWGTIIATFFYLRDTFLNSQNYISLGGFLSNLPAIPVFLSKLISPIGLSAMPIYNNYFTAAGLVVLILYVFYLFKFNPPNKFLMVLGMIWFIAFLVPGMLIKLPLAKFQFEYLECRGYLPSIGIFITAGILLNETIKIKQIYGAVISFLVIVTAFTILTYIYTNEYSDPLTFYSSIIKSNPRNVYALNERGLIYLTEGKSEEALEDLDNAIKTFPEYVFAYLNKGALYHNNNDHLKAEYFYSIALRYDTLFPKPNNGHESIYICLSEEKLFLNKYDEAIIFLNKAIGKFPYSSELHNNLGLAYYYSKKFDMALSEYNRGIELEKNSPKYYNCRGMAKYQLNDFTGALSDLNIALKLKPDFGDALGNRGLVKIKLNDYEGAISDLTRAIDYNSGLGVLWYYRGLAFYKQNKQNEAREDMDKSVGLGYRGKEYGEK